jgi:hypothetical protein
MSDEQFLARWSRRKREAQVGQAEPAPREAAEPNGSALPDRAEAEPILAETELSNLPPIEAIDAATDITAFLRQGIPQELSLAALRRAWSTDPAIRDFVGLAENAWDFNDPNAMPGFGPLGCSAEQVDALVRRIVGDPTQVREILSDLSAEAAEAHMPSAPAEAGFTHASGQAVVDSGPSEEAAPAESPIDSAAPQPPAVTEETPLRRPSHGGALPR